MTLSETTAEELGADLSRRLPGHRVVVVKSRNGHMHVSIGRGVGSYNLTITGQTGSDDRISPENIVQGALKVLGA